MRDVAGAIRSSIESLDAPQIAEDYWRHDEFAVLDDFLPADVVAQAVREVEALSASATRKRVPGFRCGGAISHFTLRAKAPTIGAIYRSPALRRLLSDLAGRELHVCPDTDIHATAVYIYEQPGDRIGYHYDVSHYRGARYTVLCGLVDDSSARLQCRLYAKEKRRPTEEFEVATRPGTMVLFNGDKLLHAVSPVKEGERRIVLALEYVTDPSMKRWRRVVSRLKDSFGYFGREALRGPTP